MTSSVKFAVTHPNDHIHTCQSLADDAPTISLQWLLNHHVLGDSI
jgi:hypothetical protein